MSCWKRSRASGQTPSRQESRKSAAVANSLSPPRTSLANHNAEPLKNEFLPTSGVLGFQVQEERGPEHAIARSPTAITAFVGRTLRGPVNQPLLVNNFADFQRIFGGLWQPSPLGYAVEQFFHNGGENAFIVRVANSARAATLTLAADSQSLILQAARPGTREFLRACVDYDNIPETETNLFNLAVQRVSIQGTENVEDQEIFAALSIDPNSDRSVYRAFSDSELVRLKGPAPKARPQPTLDPGTGLATGYISSNSDGDDGDELSDYDIIGSAVDKTGIFALDQIEHFSLLCIPPLTRDQDLGPSAMLVAARYCKQRRAMLILDPPLKWNTADEALSGIRDWSLANENALMYFPRILAYDKLRGRFESFAPGGAVAGMLARCDAASPVWAASASDEVALRPGLRPSHLVSDTMRSKLAAYGVNTLNSVRVTARSGWSPRTMAGGSAASPDWKHLPARRLALCILNSIERGTRWVVFARTHPNVGSLVEAQVSEFFARLRAEGAFSGRANDAAYFAICDERINPGRNDGDWNVHILIGFAATRAGEFHTYLISHGAASSRVQPVSLNRHNLAQYGQ